MVERIHIAEDVRIPIRISIRSVVQVVSCTVIAFMAHVLLGISWHEAYPDAVLLLSWPIYGVAYACIMHILGIAKDRIIYVSIVGWLVLAAINISDARNELSYSPQISHMVGNITAVIPDSIAHFVYYGIVSVLLYLLITNTNNALSYYMLLAFFYIGEPFGIIYRNQSVGNVQLMGQVKYYVGDAYASFVSDVLPLAFVLLLVHMLRILIHVGKCYCGSKLKIHDVAQCLYIQLDSSIISGRYKLNINYIVVIALFAAVNYWLPQHIRYNAKTYAEKVYKQESAIINDVSEWLFNHRNSIDRRVADDLCMMKIRNTEDIRSRLSIVRHNSEMYLYSINNTLKYGGSRVYANDKIMYTSVLVYRNSNHKSEVNSNNLYITAIKCDDNAGWSPLMYTRSPKFMDGSGRKDFIFNDEGVVFFMVSENGGLEKSMYPGIIRQTYWRR